MNAKASVRSGSWQQRWADPALTVLAIELAVAIFIIAPLGVLAPGSGLVLPLLLTALVLTPALLAAVLVASDNSTARAAVFVATALIVEGMVVGLHQPSVLVTSLHMIGALIMGCALIWVVAHAVFAPGRVTYHRIVGTLLLYLMIGATFAGLYGTLVLYFSFATLTSVGYGNVIPMHPLTRGLSNLEAVVGQLFPATLIARMVTLHLTGRHREEGSEMG
jgi:hypothetical protein